MQNKGIAFYFKKINEEMTKKMNIALKKYDLHFSQLEALLFIFKCENQTASLQQIKNHFNLAHPTVIGIMKRLEAKGFVKSFTDQKDKRIRLYKLTDKAYDFKSKSIIGRKNVESNFEKSLSQEEYYQLKLLLNKVYLNLIEGGYDNAFENFN